MINQCPHCQKALQFTASQMEKIDAALANLKSGVLKLSCPHCKRAIAVNPDGSLNRPAPPPTESGGVSTPSFNKSEVRPPPYPDISWLALSLYTDAEVVTEAPKALILLVNGQGREAVGKAFAERGYQTVFPESGEDALAQMRFGRFAAVVLQDGFDGTLAESPVHRQVSGLPMDIRRNLLYIVIGKGLHTMYHLEALTLSANLVINGDDVPHFETILKKGLQEMRELFEPYAEALRRAAAGV